MDQYPQEYDGQYVQILRSRIIRNERYKVDDVEFTLFLKKSTITNFTNVYDWYINVFEEAIQLFKSNCLPDYRIGIKISLPNDFNESHPIPVPFTRCNQLIGEMLADAISDVLQSNKKWDTDVLVIAVTVLRTLHGAGQRCKFFSFFFFKNRATCN